MKYFNICLLFIICALCYGLVSAQEQDSGPVSPVKRIAALRRPVGKSAKTTTTTTAAPAHNDNGGEEEDYGEEAGAHDQAESEDDEANGSLSSTTTTSTEAPKKVGPVIRPFRSNDDFLNSLKRRQQNAKKHRAEKVPASKPARRTESAEQQEENEEPVAAVAAPTPAKGFKSNSALSRRKLSKPVKASPEPATDEGAIAEESEQKEETKPKRPIGRLALRKRN